jgi:hypothetical protein
MFENLAFILVTSTDLNVNTSGHSQIRHAKTLLTCTEKLQTASLFKPPREAFASTCNRIFSFATPGEPPTPLLPLQHAGNVYPAKKSST